ncbi:MAG: hypothetical protein DRR16_26355 [Candidatus Parabeggiatoa sp. nov. 3]|nr:MAG: hypothetical protein DRR00_28385 [Gammaproteobacteria bacterium]RKZ57659.1 MAG: hypothetical protein DRQ99_26590 [Gammaproteobacteria bacterium]RKZ79109.1 MAG: hypothetical protein DRR16_26355 [Gammaproteobacteria bacterium]
MKQETYHRASWKEQIIQLQNEGNWHEMLQVAKRWTEAKPKNATAWYAVGLAFHQLGDYDHSSEAFQQSLELDPENAHAWANLGAVYSCLAEYEKAVEVYEIAIKKAPEEADILLCLGRAYLMVKRHQHKFGSVLEKLAGIDSEKAMELEACMMRNIIPGRNKNKRKKNKK